MKKIVENFVTVICIALIIWVVVSWLDINKHNQITDPENYGKFSDWNIFSSLYGF